jgi:hypothetical protein
MTLKKIDIELAKAREDLKRSAMQMNSLHARLRRRREKLWALEGKKRQWMKTADRKPEAA